MQSKGIIRILAILVAIACLWQLSFTVVSRHYENKAEKYAQTKAEAAAKLLGTEDQFTLDTLKADFQKKYLDSLSSGDKHIYFSYNYKEIKEKEINLGLDLKGGMEILLQLQFDEMVRNLSHGEKDPAFLEAMAKASERTGKTGNTDFFDAFKEEYAKVPHTKSLYDIFATTENTEGKDGIQNRTDDAVIAWLRAQGESALDNAFGVIEKRIDRFGVTQPSITKVGNNGRISISLPGIKDEDRVKKLLRGTASLEFWPTYSYYAVQDEPGNEEGIGMALRRADQALAEEEGTAHPLLSLLVRDENAMVQKYISAQNPEDRLYIAPSCIGYASATDTSKVRQFIERTIDQFPDGFAPMWEVKPEPAIKDGEYFGLVAINQSSAINGQAPIDGDHVDNARAEVGSSGRLNGQPYVTMQMTSDGARKWAKLTKDNIKKQVAIVLDGLVYSYPTVQDEITGGNSQITGNFTMEEAEDLVTVLKSGKLQAPAEIIQTTVVGPSLGAESIRNGIISFLIAFCLVLIYMIFFYQGAGLVADIALLCNVLFLLGTLASFGASLTLPGIAGLVLTLGMAVDANVIIYERIKEELAAGKGLSKAVADGYSNAYSAILDGQITTFITGVILYAFGSGPVRGFATTLMIGIITSVLTSIFITRIIIDDRVSKGKKISFDNRLTRNFLKNTHIDFLSKKKWTYIFSGILIVIALVSMFGKGFTYGVDFKGGRTYVVRFENPVSAEKVREAVRNEFDGNNVDVTQFGGTSQVKIALQYKENESSEEIDLEISDKLFSALKGFYKEGFTEDNFRNTTSESTNASIGIISSEQVGPSIAAETLRRAIIAVFLSLLAIFAYIAIRFKGAAWGLGGVVSLAHTALIVIGFFSLFTGILPFNLDVDQTFIAAILTIIGYAINDNVVIFDRIREFKSLHPKTPFKDNVNTALNATLTRTINTSVSTFITMFAIALFGGETIRGLAVALCLGVVIGTYASIFIGTPVMYDFTMWRENRRAAKKNASKK